MQSNVMTTTEAVKYLKTSKRTFLKLVHEGRIKGNRFGKGFRFLQEELDNYLRGETEEPRAAAR